MVMPKPDLTALTGGYRKTPVLQVGADVYCDSSLIALELERRYPEPTLFPAAGHGLTLALAAWASRFFDAGSALAMGLNDELPADLLQDRQEFFSHMDFATFRARAPHLFGQVVAHAHLVEQQLADGRDFLLGARRASPTRPRTTFSGWRAGLLQRWVRCCSHTLGSRVGRLACVRWVTGSAVSSRPTRRCNARAKRSR